MRIVVLLAALLLLSLPAVAQAPATLPQGFAAVEQVEGVTIAVADRKGWTGKRRDSVVNVLKEASSALRKQFGTDREVLRTRRTPGEGEGKAAVPPVLLVCHDRETHASAGGAPDGGQGPVNVIQPRKRVPLLLENGVLGDDGVVLLWHELTLVWFAGAVESCRPAWLAEGLAEYFGWEAVRRERTGMASWTAMMQRLALPRGAGDDIVQRLAAADPAAMPRATRDECWLLVHMLMTHAPEALNRLVGHLARLENDALELSDGVRRDLDRLGQHMLVHMASGDAAELARLSDQWAAALTGPGPVPRKLPITVILPPDEAITPRVTAGMGRARTMWDRGARVRYETKHMHGTVTWRAPWPGSASVETAVEDRDGDSTDPVECLASAPFGIGESRKYETDWLPFLSGVAFARVMVTWEIEGGGRYRTVLKTPYNR